ncbi:MAG TPA: zinc-ribbon domain-containing protein [Acidimicrobiales bacterium]|nr:zinc-ribbon domain-containing protein [Acidimicrobiales bacterium]
MIAMSAISFGAAALVWALASWVYFDATEHGKRYPFIWALVMLFLGWAVIPEIIYLSVRNQGAHLEVADRMGARQYLVTTSFTTMALCVAGASTALAAGLVWAVSDRLSTNDFRDLLASSLAAVIIGAVLWRPHWSVMDRQLKADLPDDQFRALYGLRRTQTLTSIFLFGGVAALTTLWFLGGAFSAMLQATYAGATGWLPVLGPALFCGAAAAYHAAFYRRVEASEQAKRFAAIPPAELIEPPRRQVASWSGPQSGTPWSPPQTGTPWQPSSGPVAGATPYGSYGPPPGAVPTVPPPVSAQPGPTVASGPGRPAFCGKCGIESSPGDQFCRACGARLGTPPSVTAA